MTSYAQLAMVFGFILVFGYLTAAGASAFERDESDVKGAFLGQFSLLFSGAIGAAGFGYGQPLHPVNGALAALILLASVTLYEWAHRTLRHRRFHIAWSGEVPDAVCAEGPYAFVRHPVYLGYLLAFLAMRVAFPRLATLAVFGLNLGLYVHAARDDERSIAQSRLNHAYAAYRARTGMFVPRLRRTSRA